MNFLFNGDKTPVGPVLVFAKKTKKKDTMIWYEFHIYTRTKYSSIPGYTWYGMYKW